MPPIRSSRITAPTLSGACTTVGYAFQGSILAARDGILARHPKLRVVGCHLGSDEGHLERLAKRLDTYPNFAVDMAARVRYFTLGDHEKARQFLVKYQDRVLYATDYTLKPRDDGEPRKSCSRRKTWTGGSSPPTTRFNFGVSPITVLRFPKT